MLIERFSTLQELEGVTGELRTLTDGVSESSGQLKHLLGDLLLLCNVELQRMRNIDNIIHLQSQLKSLEPVVDQLSHSVLKQAFLKKKNDIKLRIKQLEKKNKTLRANPSSCIVGEDPAPEETARHTDAPPTLSSAAQLYEVKFCNYGWDETKMFFKLYVNIPGVNRVAPGEDDGVKCNFGALSVNLSVQDARHHITYRLHIKRLCGAVIPDDCSYRLTEGQVLVMLAKATPGTQWGTAVPPGTDPLYEKTLLESSTKYTTLVLEYSNIINPALQLPELREWAAKCFLGLGFYQVTDPASAFIALQQFSAVCPRVVSITLSEKLMNSAVWPTLCTVVASTPCMVHLYCKDSFLSPRHTDVDAAALAPFLNNRCKLFCMIGYLSPSTVASLPADIGVIGLAINSKADAEAVSSAPLPKLLRAMCVSIKKDISPDDLKLLPSRPALQRYSLIFTGVGDTDIKWVAECMKMLLQNRRCRIMLLQSSLSHTGALALYAVFTTTNVTHVTIESPAIEESAKSSLKAMFDSSKCMLDYKWYPDYCFITA